MPAIEKLPPFGAGQELRMIVETPRGSTVKLAFEPELQLFTVARALPMGLAYPFDWGFIPGTKGDDGDPVDALALHDAATFPGVMLACKPLAVVDVDQRAKNGGREANPRLILMPTWHDRLGEFEKVTELPQRLKNEIEQFFLNATQFTDKDAKITAWRGPEAALEIVRAQRIASS